MSATKDLAAAMVGVGVLGVGPVAALIVAEEVEHFRCGIGCVLHKDDTTAAFVVDRVVSQSSTIDPNENSAGRLEVGDIILKIDDVWLNKSHRMQDVSSLIRGKEGTAVELVVVKPNNQVQKIYIVRRKLPGSKTEMLGALWQTTPRRTDRTHTKENKLQKLEQLKLRGNLSTDEFEAARRRLLDPENEPSPGKAMAPPPPSSANLASMLADDFQRLMGVHREQAVAAAASSKRRGGNEGKVTKTSADDEKDNERVLLLAL